MALKTTHEFARELLAGPDVFILCPSPDGQFYAATHTVLKVAGPHVADDAKIVVVSYVGTTHTRT